MINLEKREIIVVLILVLLGLFLRIYGMNAEGITLDESYSIFHGGKSISHILTLDDSNPFLYLLIIHPFTKLFNNSIFFSRLPFCFLGTISILLMYLLGKKIFNKKVGLISSLILTISPYHIYYSQEARSYSLLVFATLLSVLFFLKLFDKHSKKEYVYYFLSTLILIYSHIFAIFVVLVQNLYFLYIYFYSKKHNSSKEKCFIKKNDFKYWIFIQGSLLILYIPVLINLFNYIQEMSFWLTNDFLYDILRIYYLFSGGRHLSVILPLLFFTGLYFLFFKKFKFSIQNKHYYFLVLLIIIPIFIPLIYSILFSPILLPKYVIFTIIPFILILSFGLSKLNKITIYVLLIFIVLLSLVYIYQEANSIEKKEWILVNNTVNNLKNSDSTIIINPGYNLHPFLYYYYPVCFSQLNIYECASRENIYTLWGEFEKEKQFTDFNYKIIYITKEMIGIKEDYYLDYLMKNYSIKQVYSFEEFEHSEIIVYYFVKK